MIEEISIRDLGVIGEARLPLGPGFTVLTGETGAGKTMVVTALGLLLGDRADAHAIRAGSDRAVVEGRWNVADGGQVAERVRDAGGEVDDGELILARSVSNEGRGRAIVGGRTAPVGVLVELGHQLVVVHGQSEQSRLRSSTEQRRALDRFAGTELRGALDDYVAAFEHWNTVRLELDSLVTDRDRRAREADGLRIAMTEIDDVAPVAGEDVELAERAERLANAEDLRAAATAAHDSISSPDIGGPDDVIGLLDAARKNLERVSSHDPALDGIIEALHEANILALDVSGRLAAYLGALDDDSSRELEVVNERRAALTTLTRKYGPTIDDALEYLETGSARLLELDSDTDRIDELTLEVEAARAAVESLADRVTGIRVAHAENLAARVTDELTALAMANAVLTIDVTDRGELTPTGRDAVAFLLRPHSGAEPRPISKGASGGELSRVMLAIEVVIAATDPVPTFIFDEVDAGVGGAAAIEVGRRLAALAATSQVIVVTHLAQVAAFATNHLRVVKDDEGSVTTSNVERLDGEDRIAEMARLLSGLDASGSALAHARELIDTARSLTT
ncbi:DNA repair protein RecN [Marisediminicola sp. LYQ134]|uniref:DNA repair protein RecN n=1 Tax=Marisediminicola sp. LYQ134 TaxID=3391061 RepID=UPI0039837E1E